MGRTCVHRQLLGKNTWKERKESHTGVENNPGLGGIGRK